MIYFDNAATTMPKPQVVVDAVSDAINTLGNPSRGIYKSSLDGLRCLMRARMAISNYFEMANPMNVAFTMNATTALNAAISSVDGHIVTTAAEHNSVLRPIYRSGDYSIVELDDRGRLDLDRLEDKIKPDTKAIVMTHASNFTGNVFDIYGAAEICKRKNIVLIVDAAQSAGLIPIDIGRLGDCAVCFSGHKSFFGPQGTGGICIGGDFRIRPLTVGGSGINSFDKTHPSSMPEVLEAGTQNVHGVAGLLAGVEYIGESGRCFDDADSLARYFADSVKKIDMLTLYGDMDADLRVPVVSLNHSDMTSDELAFRLWSDYEIATRAGAHCAPLMHRTFGTEQSGAVRFSFSHFNTKQEVDKALDALLEIIEG